MTDRIKGKGLRVLIAALLAAVRRVFTEIAIDPQERELVNRDLNTVQAILDSDGDGVPDDLDPAPHDASVRTAEEAARRYVEANLGALVEAAVVRVLNLEAPVAERVPNAGLPTGFAANTAEPVNNVVSVTHESDAPVTGA